MRRDDWGPGLPVDLAPQLRYTAPLTHMSELPPPTRAEIAAETARRRTFAIISHPDAGKTTLTEKLLLYSGMIRTAGMVRARKGGKATTSDWMAMEQERGISITASAMQFTYKDAIINLLDTPGHQDFSEDTYRTLTAADTAIMVIDAAKGVEAQTKKLFAVCKMKGIPVLTFINKMDLPGRDPVDLLNEVEQVLGIQASPLNWPIGYAREFCGVVPKLGEMATLFKPSDVGGSGRAELRDVPVSALANAGISESAVRRVTEELELMRGAGNPFTREAFIAGKVTGAFFGSAITNFGVEPFFDAFVELAAAPAPRIADGLDGKEVFIDPVETNFSAFVFKIQANMNPRHRDSMAYMRVCSGRFERDLVIKHHRTGKEMRLSRSHAMMAGERNTIDVAFPGDIVGVTNPGAFAIGDTLSLDGGFNFKPMLQFPPEVVAQVRPTDVNRHKAFEKGIEQLCSEGTIQLLRPLNDTHGRPMVAAVGRLQFEVLQYRLRDEYGVATELDAMPYQRAGWLIGDPLTFRPPSSTMLAKDTHGRIVMLYSAEWEKRYALEQNPKHQLADFA